MRNLCALLGKAVTNMTYTVSGEMLNPTHSLIQGALHQCGTWSRSAEPRSRVEPSSHWITLHQVELESADPVQVNGQPVRSTQPGHLSVGRHNEYQWKLGWTL